ncbi:uncharacterized protein LOC121264723 [Juglans microcarpa x Juglans regia]|uniref:uncharacterized protein LOC121264723 n=1 Tax=Juglans microcarpa x Juglans regia TaxID=2249226 RepID=UPI001B7E37C1|nr:uncharacterized protein LOC121264723 [Juglans microcarpa x Juglans regia]
MDLDEWEYLPDDGYLGEKKTFWGKPSSDSKTVFNMNYFLCPSPNSMKITEPPGLPGQVVEVPIHLEPTSGIGKAPQDGEPVKDITKVPIESSVMRPVVILERPNVPNTGVMEADEDVVSHVFFKMKENEFVDMKKDSPMSSCRGFMPQIDTSTFQFEDKLGESLESKTTSPRTEAENRDCCDSNKKVTWEESGSGSLNIWKWSFTGIGAICSFGVAAATICILFLGSHQRNKQHQESQKFRFRIHTDGKGMSKQASKLKEAISVVRGVHNPISRAHITLGGFSEAN